MEEITNGKKKCPNCGGELENIGNSLQWRCLYCDSVFQNNEPKVHTAANGSDDASGKRQALLLCKVSPNGMSKDTVKALYILGDYVGIGLGVNDYLEKISRATTDNRFVAIKNSQPELAQTVMRKIRFPKYPQEKFLLYKSDGFVSKDKAGVIITDKSLYFLHNKSFFSLSLDVVATLSASASINEWRINHDKNCTITGINAYSADEIALYLGLICELARQNHPESYQITIDGTFT